MGTLGNRIFRLGWKQDKNHQSQMSYWTNQVPCWTDPAQSDCYLDFIYLGEVARHLFCHLNHLLFYWCAGFHVLCTKSMLLWNHGRNTENDDQHGPLNALAFPPPLVKVGYQLKLTKDLHETIPVFICQSNARILGDISHNLLEELTSVTESITMYIHCIYLCIDHI